MFTPLLAKLFRQLQYLFVDQVEQLGIARLDHLCQGLTLQTPRRTTTYARHFHALIFSNDGTQRTTVANFNRFGVAWRRAKGVSDITGHDIASKIGRASGRERM